MQAIVYTRYGPPDVLEYKEIAKPTPGDGEVLVRVHTAAVNPYDWHFLRGTPGFIRIFTGLLGPKFPRLGADAAGVVEAVGPGTKELKVGDRVFGLCKGAFAGYACGKESELAVIPGGVSFEQAASVPIAGITALQGLRDCGGLTAGQAVLINGAAGGVGTFSVQIARALGATVTGVCSARNGELVRSLGAERVIDYAQEDFTLGDRRFDVIFDLVGNHELSAIRRALTPLGTLVGCGGGGPERSGVELMAGMLGQAIAGKFAKQKLTGVLAKVNTADLNVLAGMLESGAVKPVISRSYSLAKTAEAVRHVESCHAVGKVVIAVSSSGESENP
jgi:NADPH:quinone reductase-like Zn-dependent oxidoreductase